MGKGEIARYEQFLLFPQCFQKACFPGASKGVIAWEWVKAVSVLYVVELDAELKDIKVEETETLRVEDMVEEYINQAHGVFFFFFLVFSFITLGTFKTTVISHLTHSLKHHFEAVPNSKKLQTTTEMWILKYFKIQIA